MGISIGGIDVTDSIINTEFRITVLEKVVDRLLKNMPPGSFTAQDIEKIREETFNLMQSKYPNAGLSRKS